MDVHDGENGARISSLLSTGVCERYDNSIAMMNENVSSHVHVLPHTLFSSKYKKKDLVSSLLQCDASNKHTTSHAKPILSYSFVYNKKTSQQNNELIKHYSSNSDLFAKGSRTYLPLNNIPALENATKHVYSSLPTIFPFSNSSDVNYNKDRADTYQELKRGLVPDDTRIYVEPLFENSQCPLNYNEKKQREIEEEKKLKEEVNEFNTNNVPAIFSLQYKNDHQSPDHSKTSTTQDTTSYVLPNENKPNDSTHIMHHLDGKNFKRRKTFSIRFDSSSNSHISHQPHYPYSHSTVKMLKPIASLHESDSYLPTPRGTLQHSNLHEKNNRFVINDNDILPSTTPRNGSNPFSAFLPTSRFSFFPSFFPSLCRETAIYVDSILKQGLRKTSADKSLKNKSSKTIYVPYSHPEKATKCSRNITKDIGNHCPNDVNDDNVGSHKLCIGSLFSPRTDTYLSTAACSLTALSLRRPTSLTCRNESKYFPYVCNESSCNESSCNESSYNESSCNESSCNESSCNESSCNESSYNESSCNESSCNESSCNESFCNKPSSNKPSSNKPDHSSTLFECSQKSNAFLTACSQCHYKNASVDIDAIKNNSAHLGAFDEGATQGTNNGILTAAFLAEKERKLLHLEKETLPVKANESKQDADYHNTNTGLHRTLFTSGGFKDAIDNEWHTTLVKLPQTTTTTAQRDENDSPRSSKWTKRFPYQRAEQTCVFSSIYSGSSPKKTKPYSYFAPNDIDLSMYSAGCPFTYNRQRETASLVFQKSFKIQKSCNFISSPYVRKRNHHRHVLFKTTPTIILNSSRRPHSPSHQNKFSLPSLIANSGTFLCGLQKCEGEEMQDNESEKSHITTASVQTSYHVFFSVPTSSLHASYKHVFGPTKRLRVGRTRSSARLPRLASTVTVESTRRLYHHQYHGLARVQRKKTLRNLRNKKVLKTYRSKRNSSPLYSSHGCHHQFRYCDNHNDNDFVKNRRQEVRRYSVHNDGKEMIIDRRKNSYKNFTTNVYKPNTHYVHCRTHTTPCTPRAPYYGHQLPRAASASPPLTFSKRLNCVVGRPCHRCHRHFDCCCSSSTSTMQNNQKELVKSKTNKEPKFTYRLGDKHPRHSESYSTLNSVLDSPVLSVSSTDPKQRNGVIKPLMLLAEESYPINFNDDDLTYNHDADDSIPNHNDHSFTMQNGSTKAQSVRHTSSELYNHPYLNSDATTLESSSISEREEQENLQSTSTYDDFLSFRSSTTPPSLMNQWSTCDNDISFSKDFKTEEKIYTDPYGLARSVILDSLKLPYHSNDHVCSCQTSSRINLKPAPKPSQLYRNHNKAHRRGSQAFTVTKLHNLVSFAQQHYSYTTNTELTTLRDTIMAGLCNTIAPNAIANYLRHEKDFSLQYSALPNIPLMQQVAIEQKNINSSEHNNNFPETPPCKLPVLFTSHTFSLPSKPLQLASTLIPYRQNTTRNQHNGNDKNNNEFQHQLSALKNKKTTSFFVSADAAKHNILSVGSAILGQNVVRQLITGVRAKYFILHKEPLHYYDCVVRLDPIEILLSIHTDWHACQTPLAHIFELNRHPELIDNLIYRGPRKKNRNKKLFFCCPLHTQQDVSNQHRDNNLLLPSTSIASSKYYCGNITKSLPLSSSFLCKQERQRHGLLKPGQQDVLSSLSFLSSSNNSPHRKHHEPIYHAGSVLRGAGGFDDQVTHQSNDYQRSKNVVERYNVLKQASFFWKSQRYRKQMQHSVHVRAASQSTFIIVFKDSRIVEKFIDFLLFLQLFYGITLANVIDPLVSNSHKPISIIRQSAIVGQKPENTKNLQDCSSSHASLKTPLHQSSSKMNCFLKKLWFFSRSRRH